ncbi:MAG TPA: ABC transporter permease, partial [Bacillota bacterium]
MKAYLSVFRVRLLVGLQYRVAALAGVATQFFWGFMFIMIYQAFYLNSTKAQPITLEQLISYIWLQQAFLALTMLWYRDNEIFNLITGGNIAYELCRPWSLYGFWYAKLLAQRLSGALLRCFPILIIAFILPEPYRMSLPPNFSSLGLFLITLCLGVLVLVAISMFIYISVIVTMSPAGSLLMFGVFGEFFSGAIIPVPLMPLWLQRITYVLPFRLAADLPFRVYSGNIASKEAFIGIMVQILWLTILVLVGRITLKKLLRRIVVQGG